MASLNLTVALIRAGTLASGAALLAAVFAQPAVAQQADPVDPPPQATQQVEKRDLKVEAFGDSYFTGVGAGQYTRPDARRQSRAAGFLQALSRLETANPGLSVTVNNHSAIGATIDNLYDTEMVGGLLGQNMPMNAPQLQGVDPNADVAIMGFGGNDVGFVDAIMSCFGADTPLRNFVDERLAGQLNNSLSREAYLADAARPPGQQQTLIGELVRGIQDVRRAMPNAKIVVTTYPEAVDPNSTSMLSVVSSTELATFRELARALNDGIRQAAGLTGATVADNADAFAGHEVYTDDPYLHDLGPQWQRDDRDEAMHPNAAGQTVMSDAIADALAKVTGLKPAAPRTGTQPYPTDGLTYTPRQPAIPAQEQVTPDPINWTPDEPAREEEPTDGTGPADGTGPIDGTGPTDGLPDVGPPEVSEPDGDLPGSGAPEASPPVLAPPETPADQPKPPEPPSAAPAPSDGQTNSPTPPPDQEPADSDPADNPENGGEPDSSGSHTGPADNPENGGDRGESGSLGGQSGPADNPENGGDRGQSGSSGSHTGPADNPENGGDRGESGSLGGQSGPADNPENGGDRGESGGYSGPADNPGNGGDRGESGGGLSGPADNPGSGGDLGGSASVGPADNPENGGDRGQTRSDDASGPADNGSDSSESSGGGFGPADNPENGGDRDSPSYGGWGSDPSTPIS